MSTIIILTAALLPAILLWLYICMKDPQPEPLSQLAKATIWGMALCIPVGVLEVVIEAIIFSDGPTSLLGSTANAFFVAAIPEESCKLLALWLVLRKNPFFDEHYDGIVYAVCVGLGFAAVENVFYVFGNEDWMSVAIARSLLAVPGHYAFAILMGYYYSLYHFVDRSPHNAICVLLVPVLAHGIYDAIAMSGTVNAIAGGLSTIIIIYFCIKMHKVAHKKITAHIQRDADNKA